jgi:hypothetical protein
MALAPRIIFGIKKWKPSGVRKATKTILGFLCLDWLLKIDNTHVMSVNKFKFEATSETSKNHAKAALLYVLFNGSRFLKYSVLLLFYGLIFAINGFDVAIAVVPIVLISIFAYIAQRSTVKNIVLSLEASGSIDGEITTVQINKETVIVENKIVTHRLSPKNIYKILKVDEVILLQLTKSRQAMIITLPYSSDLYKVLCDFKKREKSK